MKLIGQLVPRVDRNKRVAVAFLPAAPLQTERRLEILFRWRQGWRRTAEQTVRVVAIRSMRCDAAVSDRQQGVAEHPFPGNAVLEILEARVRPLEARLPRRDDRVLIAEMGAFVCPRRKPEAEPRLFGKPVLK